ncbi:hypothetical protein M6B38_106110 [Iris pallida]|uniref:Uncharacterized protein n=1 Tax=Iris pallida TaxID=29817 RepID=A0AAX6ESA3_IRIPA|nr:hypothetical protein M6B38_106110 [Iris pallida]
MFKCAILYSTSLATISSLYTVAIYLQFFPVYILLFPQYLYLTLLHVICFLTCYDMLRCTVLAPVLTGPVDKFYR